MIHEVDTTVDQPHIRSRSVVELLEAQRGPPSNPPDIVYYDAHISIPINPANFQVWFASDKDAPARRGGRSIPGQLTSVGLAARAR